MNNRKTYLLLSLLALCGCQHNEEMASAHPDFMKEWQKKAENLLGESVEIKEKKIEREPESLAQVNLKTYRDRLPSNLISVKFMGDSLSSVLRSLGRLGNVNLVVDDSLAETVTLDLNQVPWNQVFEGVLDSYSLDYVYSGDIIRVLTPASLQKRLSLEQAKVQLNAAQQQVFSTTKPVMRIVKIDHLEVEKIAEMMRKLLQQTSESEAKNLAGIARHRGTVEVDKATNTIVINAIPEDVNKMLDLVERLDVPSKQVRIEAQIVMATKSTARELGVKWAAAGKVGNTWISPSYNTGQPFDGSTGDGSFPLSNVFNPIENGSSNNSSSTSNPIYGGNLGIAYEGSSLALAAQLSALESAGKANVLSSPRITTLDNIPAFIESGSEIPYQSSSENTGTTTEFKKAVLRLDVQPHVIDNELIKLKVEASNDEPDRSLMNSNDEPAITTRKAGTTVLLRDGQTMVIAGLTKESNSDNNSGIPLLKDLPFIGHLFKNISKEAELSDLLIFITPYIIDSQKKNISREQVA
ncbi:MAG: type IV pilus secretin PilQ, partial [Lentisphaeria bacterium]